MPDENKQDAKKKAQEVDVVIVGGGQAGLAMSQCLTARNIRHHVVLERGRLVERWRSERWDSLRLLTPNWMTRLPGIYQYCGVDPNGFMTMPETIEFLETYAKQIAAPVKTNCEVISVENIQGDDRYLVKTSVGEDFVSRNIVVATGFCDKTRLPEFAESLPKNVLQLSPCDYKRPSQILPGNVLIVGVSATGCQIADEILAFDSRSRTTKIGKSQSRWATTPCLARIGARIFCTGSTKLVSLLPRARPRKNAKCQLPRLLANATKTWIYACCRTVVSTLWAKWFA